MNTDNFLIENSDIEIAQNICKIIMNPSVRNRAVANVLAAEIAAKYFDKEKFQIDTESGLHNISKVLENIDISDLYVNNNYIDVRVFFNEEEMSVPVENFEKELLPAAYMFIKINQELSGAEVLGFIKPENINKDVINDGYYKVLENELVSFYEIEHLLSEYNEESVVEDRDIFAYLDGTIEDVFTFYINLLHSKDGRQRLLKAVKANEVFKFISIDKKEIPTYQDESELAIEDNSEELNVVEDFDNNVQSFDDNLVLDNNVDELMDENSNFLLEDNEVNSLNELDDGNSDDVSLENDNDMSDVIEIDNSNLENSQQEFENGEDDNSDFVFDNLDDEANENDADFVIEDEKSDNVQSLIVDNLDQEDEASDTEKQYNQFTTVTTPSGQDDDFLLDEVLSDETGDVIIDSPVDKNSSSGSQEQIEALFNKNSDEEENEAVEYVQQNKKKQSPKFLVIFILVALIGAGAFIGLTKFNNTSETLPENDIVSNETPTENPVLEQKNVSPEPMPNETIDVASLQSKQNEGIATSIPAIEQNLDASILVSNLKVDWEVPSGYAANTAAKRYLIKMGKVIQLNLKTELLLLNKPPISNKIAVEIKYNAANKKFEALSVTVSSGEKTVDDVILKTVQKALSMNLSSNMDSFAKLQGNPILIIHL